MLSISIDTKIHSCKTFHDKRGFMYLSIIPRLFTKSGDEVLHPTLVANAHGRRRHRCVRHRSSQEQVLNWSVGTCVATLNWSVGTCVGRLNWSVGTCVGRLNWSVGTCVGRLNSSVPFTNYISKLRSSSSYTVINHFQLRLD